MKSGLDFGGLTDLAKQTPEQTKAGHQPLTRERLGSGTVLAFDQSLRAAGFVAITADATEVQVLEAGVIKTPQEVTGVEVDLTRTASLFLEAVELLGRYPTFTWVHESPPNPAALKNVKGNPYSSLLASGALRCAAAVMGDDFEMLGAMPAKNLVSGQSKDKKIAHEALKRDCFPWIVGAEEHVTNEATRDALLVALLWLQRRNRG